MTAALRLSGVVKRFGATHALDGASLEVRPGEVHALLGENGAGKSTLLSVLGGLLRPDSGSLEVAGQAYAPRSPRDARAARIALIHQELSLFSHLTVAENVLMGSEPSRRGLWDRERAQRQTREVLAEFGHPEVDPDAVVGRLPIGARQVVEICRAIATRARVVLMDEPTSSLARGDVDRLFALVARLSAAGVAVVYISHFLEESRAVASAYTVLRDGRSVGSGALAATGNDQLIALMVGRTVEELFPQRRPVPEADVALEVRGLSAPGLREASFTLRRGEVLGIFGLMGSGRTEMLRALVGLARPTAGSLGVLGRERPLTAPPAARLGAGLGYLSEDRKGEGLALPLSVADNVTLTRLSSCSRAGVLDPRAQRAQAEERAREVDVRMRGAGQPVRTLSGGNQQKVAFARIVHQQAEVLLLDEPTRGIDVASKAQLYAAIVRAAEAGRAVLMVSSYLPELLGVCDRVAVMCRGRLGAARAVADWTPESVLEAAIAG
ncbi:MAG TPA: sugar ABC transporter ATP-binding protein [Vicinamibacteria bacterium]